MIPTKWYNPTAASDDVPCEWIVMIRGVACTVYLVWGEWV